MMAIPPIRLKPNFSAKYRTQSRPRRVQEAPGGNPGTPGMKTTSPSMPDDGT